LGRLHQQGEVPDRPVRAEPAFASSTYDHQTQMYVSPSNASGSPVTLNA
jgi:hypothetical protein